MFICRKMVESQELNADHQLIQLDFMFYHDQQPPAPEL